MREDIYYAKEVIWQFSITKLKVFFFLHSVRLNVVTSSCSTRVETTIDVASRVHESNFGRRCNLWRVPLIVDNFSRRLAAANSALVPLHGTIQMEFCHIRETHRVQESVSTVKFLQRLSQNLFLSSIWSEVKWRYSNSATWHNKGDCNSDPSYVCEHVVRDRLSFRCASSM
jgi:hypothetical protein